MPTRVLAHDLFQNYQQRITMRDTLSLGTVGMILAGVCCAATLRAQQVPTAEGWLFGGYLGAVLTAPSASFRTMPGVANCLDSGAFTGGSGFGFGLFAEAEYHPSNGEGFMGHLGYGGVLGYAAEQSHFSTTERIGDAVTIGGEVSPVVDLYQLDLSTGAIVFEPALRYYVGADLPLVVSLEGSVGYLLSTSYSQKETIDSPSGATYSDGTSQRNVTSGDIPGGDAAGMITAIGIGIGYDVPLSPTLRLRPQIEWQFGLNSPVSGVSWNPNRARFGISLLISPPAEQSTPLRPKETHQQ